MLLPRLITIGLFVFSSMFAGAQVKQDPPSAKKVQEKSADAEAVHAWKVRQEQLKASPGVIQDPRVTVPVKNKLVRKKTRKVPKH